VENRLLIEGNYWTGMHAQITGCGAPGSSDQGANKSGKMPIEEIHDALQGIPKLGKWAFDVHQYFDFHGTGGHDCGFALKNSSCNAGTLQQVKDFVNWEKFIGFIHKKNITVAVTEFGGYPTQTCANWVRSFLQLLEQGSSVDGSSGVILWSAWRVFPHTSWYTAISPTDPFADCIQFAEPQSFDPQQYAKLFCTPSGDYLQHGIKQMLKDFVCGGSPPPPPHTHTHTHIQAP
jgi:hypothetical protein